MPKVNLISANTNLDAELDTIDTAENILRLLDTDFGPVAEGEFRFASPMYFVNVFYLPATLGDCTKLKGAISIDLPFSEAQSWLDTSSSSMTNTALRDILLGQSKALALVMPPA